MARVEGFLRIVFLFLANLSLIPARGDTEDYQRREYSLVKPYYGNMICVSFVNELFGYNVSSIYEDGNNLANVGLVIRRLD